MLTSIRPVMKAAAAPFIAAAGFSADSWSFVSDLHRTAPGLRQRALLPIGFRGQVLLVKGTLQGLLGDMSDVCILIFVNSVCGLTSSCEWMGK